MTTKECIGCRLFKPIDEFALGPNHGGAPSIYPNSYCKPCKVIYCRNRIAAIRAGTWHPRHRERPEDLTRVVRVGGRETVTITRNYRDPAIKKAFIRQVIRDDLLFCWGEHCDTPSGHYGMESRFFHADHIDPLRDYEAEKLMPMSEAIKLLQVLCPDCHRIKSMAEDDRDDEG